MGTDEKAVSSAQARHCVTTLLDWRQVSLCLRRYRGFCNSTALHVAVDSVCVVATDVDEGFAWSGRHWRASRGVRHSAAPQENSFSLSREKHTIGS